MSDTLTSPVSEQPAPERSFMQQISGTAGQFISRIRDLPVPLLPRRTHQPSVRVQADDQQRKSAAHSGGKRLRKGAFIAAAAITAAVTMASPSQAQAATAVFDFDEPAQVQVQQPTWQEQGQTQLLLLVKAASEIDMEKSMDLMDRIMQENPAPLSNDDLQLLGSMRNFGESFNAINQLASDNISQLSSEDLQLINGMHTRYLDMEHGPTQLTLKNIADAYNACVKVHDLQNEQEIMNLLGHNAASPGTYDMKVTQQSLQQAFSQAADLLSPAQEEVQTAKVSHGHHR